MVSLIFLLVSDCNYLIVLYLKEYIGKLNVIYCLLGNAICYWFLYRPSFFYFYFSSSLLLFPVVKNQIKDM